MASSHVEFASCLLNRPPTPTTSTSYKKNIKAYPNPNPHPHPHPHPDSSWLPSSSQSENSNVDLSWLPNYNDTSKPDDSNLQNVQNDFDDSWLPNYNDTRRNTASKSSNSNRSWLPPIPGNKNKGQNDSWLPSTSTSTNFVKNENRNKEISKHNKQSLQKSESSRSRQVSPSKLECSVETNSLGGVSTLLRRWKDLADPRTANRKPKNSSATKTHNNPSAIGHPPPKVSDEGSESRRTSLSRPLSCQTSTPSRATRAIDVEKEKTRVVDIIKKLSKVEELDSNDLSPRLSKTLDHQQDKQRELEHLARRKPVSNFSYRGRIKAVLRVTFIRLGIEPKTHRCSVLETMKHDISDTRDQFSTGLKQGASRKNNDNGGTRMCHASLVSEVEVSFTTNSQKPEYTTTSNQSPNGATSVGCNSVREVSNELESIAASNPSVQEAKNHHQITEPSSPRKNVMDKAQGSNSSSHSSHSKEDTLVPNREYCQFLSSKAFSKDKGLDNGIQLQSDEGDHRQALENCHNWISEYPQPQSDWDEEECYNMQLYNVYDDWISDISRPKSVWENMRQARYQEMFHLYSYNRDILQLLERRSVSTFLSSGLQDKIDQIMMSRAQGYSHPEVCSKIGKQEVAGRVSSREEAMEVEEEEEDDSMVDEDEDGWSGIKKQCNSECNDFVDHAACSSLPVQSPALEERSWSHHNAIYGSDQMAFPHSSNLIKQPAIEMELINVLRGHLAQIQQEMMELRKSVTTCVDMQIQMQRSIKQDVAAAVAQTVEKTKCCSNKGRCCVCYATQVDSFLYRCGYMCACFDCSVELQCRNGKCPECQAPILDVLRMPC